MLRIVNFDDSATIGHSLPLVQGEVPKRCLHPAGSRCTSGCQQWVACKCNGVHYRTEARRGSFKMLVRLRRGRNRLLFTLEQSSKRLQFQLQFEPRSSGDVVRLLYLTCPDATAPDELFDRGHFQSPADRPSSVDEARRKIALAALMVQSFLAATLPGGSTFRLALDVDLWPIVHVLRVPTPVQQLFEMDEHQLWRHMGEQILSNGANLLDADNEIGESPSSSDSSDSSEKPRLADRIGSGGPSEQSKWLAFCAFSRYVFDGRPEQAEQLAFDEIIRMTKGFVALGGGDLALMAGCTLFTWPSELDEVVACFRDQTKIDCTRYMDDSGGNPSTYGGMYATTLGTAMHELGHVFDLGHERYGIMGRDFEQINGFFDLADREPSKPAKCRWWNRASLEILGNHRFLRCALEREQDRPLTPEERPDAGGRLDDCVYDTEHFMFDEQTYSVWSRNGVRLVEYRDSEQLTIRFERFDQPRRRLKLRNYTDSHGRKDTADAPNPRNFDHYEYSDTSVFIMDVLGHYLRLE